MVSFFFLVQFNAVEQMNIIILLTAFSNKKKTQHINHTHTYFIAYGPLYMSIHGSVSHHSR
jgi:hypothetical protein